MATKPKKQRTYSSYNYSLALIRAFLVEDLTVNPGIVADNFKEEEHTLVWDLLAHIKEIRLANPDDKKLLSNFASVTYKELTDAKDDADATYELVQENLVPILASMVATILAYSDRKFGPYTGREWREFVKQSNTTEEGLDSVVGDLAYAEQAVSDLLDAAGVPRLPAQDRDDTKHLKSSKKNAERLAKSVKQVKKAKKPRAKKPKEAKPKVAAFPTFE